MPLSDNPSEVAKGIISYLNDSKDELGIRRVWYGDDDMVPETPAITVVPGNMTTEISETAFTITNQIPIILTVLHSRLDNQEVNREQCDEKAFDIRQELHKDPRMGGLVVFGYVSSMEPGFTTRQRVMLRATRIIWSGMSKTRMSLTQ
jgi:hypothetical protein